MTLRHNIALEISNSRLICAIYFSLLSILFVLIMSCILDFLGVQRILPISHALVLGGLIAAIFGALFGERILHSPPPHFYSAFWWAVLMMLVAVPVYCLGFMVFFKIHHAPVFLNASILDLIRFYFLVTIYSYLIFGIWIALFGGLCALYLRKYLIYYILNSKMS